MTGKLIRLIQKCEVGLSQTILRRLYRRAIFEAKVSVEEMRLRWQKRPVGNMPWNGALAEGITWSDLPQRLRCSRQPRFLPDANLRNQIGSLLSNFAPKAMNLTVTEADRICEHVFDLLGSGPTPLGEKIDWHTDFKTGHRWNLRTYYKRIRPAPYPGGYDIKVPWELSRCQHFVRLGQAYWITGDEKYAQEFVAQVTDWIESNPWPWGVNWACTMDVAIRAVNWLWGYAFFRDSPCLTDQFLETLWRNLLVHGRHIYRNLENQGGFTNNHYLADLVGLIYLGILCPEFREASEWREFGLRELWKEMFVQVYPDGVSFEASIPYHRLATEFFLYTIILCQRNDIPVPDEVMARLEKMLEFVMYYTRPDGTVPLIGDGDNGRLLRLKVWDPPEREWNDHRYLLAIGAVMFGRQDFAQVAGEQWEESVWLLGGEALRFREQVHNWSHLFTSSPYQPFADAGLHVIHFDRFHFILNCGSNRRSPHGHNDFLSFELFIKDHAWIIDPGTYTYTSDYGLRHLFRSTEYHNTPLLVLGNRILEQNSIKVYEPFCPTCDAAAILTSKTVGDRFVILQATLTNYGGRSIQVNREIVVDTMLSACVVRDELPVSHGYQLAVNLHHNNGAVISFADQFPGSYVLRQGNSFLLTFLMNFQDVEHYPQAFWVSHGYGKRSESLSVRYTARDSGKQKQEIMVGFIWIESDSDLCIWRAANALRDLHGSMQSYLAICT